MLKNIAEKIDKMEQKRISQTVSWRDDIERYKEESTIQQQKTLDELTSFNLPNDRTFALCTTDTENTKTNI